ncbi:uncharacterized protein ASCRUDRAFT_77799 [Ascoidea rubescens DSM 1968]|uniref:Uncharacterized protein n=1 Tax=Ascoidea rubescens DSM 1968 TaxID=1344418 RepID=A0A1D2VAT5_9ASCO|nr:hypothetical protein ASCRUDRAFT_77799 [Ascoidea rubescens DSM 1968]ODV58547.1 hypothetical protein ASCRUDRAFT_77799 [Ascoidea rubescens DSM 1968]
MYRRNGESTEHTTKTRNIAITPVITPDVDGVEIPVSNRTRRSAGVSASQINFSQLPVSLSGFLL